MSGSGFLVPDTYVLDAPGEADMNLLSIFWGLSIAVALFSAINASMQSRKMWMRMRRVTAYIVLVWSSWAANVIVAAVAWCFQRQIIKPSFQVYFVIAFFWSLQIQLLMQIIIDRMAILMPSPRDATKLRWGVFLVLLLVNFGTLIVWTPAQLQISPRWVSINEIWGRCEKGIFFIVDFALNLRFVYLIRNRMASHGLSKYVSLFRLNMVLIAFSVSLDLMLIGLMSLPGRMMYLQFPPVAYLLKLYIAMIMADLVSKVSRETSSRRRSQRLTANRAMSMTQKPAGRPWTGRGVMEGHHAVGKYADDGIYPGDGRIQVTVETQVTRKPIDEDDDSGSPSSSTQELRNRGGFMDV
ncbi:hypothetical protein ACJ41O_012081 [Fusarium nematophilum]